MYRLALILSFTVSVCKGQIETYQSFFIDHGEVVWSQIYSGEEKTTQKLTEEVLALLKSKSYISNVQYDSGELFADISNLKVDYKKYHAKYFQTSTIIRTGKWFGKMRVSFKDNRYRVIIYGLHFTATQPARTAGKISMEAHPMSGTINEWVLTPMRNSFKKSRFKNLDLLHWQLRELFTIYDNSVINTDW